MRTQLVIGALQQALGSRPTTGETIFHSDRGSQYGSDVRTEIFEYIEAYCNTQRKHLSLGYQIPSQFEAQIHSLN